MEFSSGIISLSGFGKCLASIKGSPKFYQGNGKNMDICFLSFCKKDISQ